LVLLVWRGGSAIADRHSLAWLPRSACASPVLHPAASATQPDTHLHTPAAGPGELHRRAACAAAAGRGWLAAAAWSLLCTWPPGTRPAWCPLRTAASRPP
jgi:hypothetical protein